MKFLIIVLYVLANLAVGYWAMRKSKNVSDFFLGGRNIGPWMSAFAYGTTYFSAVLFVGYAGKLGWGFGLGTMPIVIGNCVVGTFLAWYVLGGRTRNMTVNLNALTMPEFLEARYGSSLLKTLSGIVIFCMLVPYSASVYTGLAYLFETNLGLTEFASLASLAILTGLYIMMGGYLALTLTDFIRGIVEIIGVVIMVLFLVGKQGGFALATSRLTDPATMPGLYTTTALDNGASVPGWIILASLVIVTSLGPWGLPQMVQKFYSIKSVADIKRTMWVASAFALLMAFGAYYTGALAHLFYPEPPAEIMVAVGGKMAPNFDKLMPHFLVSETPSVISMVILILIFSASMSSLSSLVLVSSSAIAIDLLGKTQDGRKVYSMGLMRFFCGVFVALSLWVAWSKFDVIINLMVISWGALAGAFLAPFIYGLFWRRATKAAAVTSFVSGLVISVVLLMLLGKPGVPIAGAVSILVPLLIMPVVSLFTPPPPASIVRQAFDATTQ